MNCKTVSTLILTSYSDGLATLTERALVDGHLAECSQCRQLAERVKKETVLPFAGLPPRVPPERVWHAVRREIELQEAALSWKEKLRRIFTQPLPAVLGSAVVMMLLLIPVFLSDDNLSMPPAEDTVQYFFQGISPYYDATYSENGSDVPTDYMLQ